MYMYTACKLTITCVAIHVCKPDRTRGSVEVNLTSTLGMAFLSHPAGWGRVGWGGRDRR